MTATGFDPFAIVPSTNPSTDVPDDPFNPAALRLTADYAAETSKKLLTTVPRPREMRLGSRVLISEEAARDWRRQREAASQS
jgi:hypothetical protein